jgi:hypothetical protein
LCIVYVFICLTPVGLKKDDKAKNTVFYQGNVRIVCFNDMSRTE